MPRNSKPSRAGDFRAVSNASFKRDGATVVKEIPLSWRSPKTEVRQSPIHGRGLFATADMAKDEIVMIKGGHIVSRDFLQREVTPKLGPVELQIGDDLFITPVTADEREGSMLYSNHSCDPSLGLRGSIVFVALRNIQAGEELTHDWCMTDDDSYETECTCGSANCRRVLTGKDWQRPELQARYRGYFSTYLADKISQNVG
jgi:uncharacterized protein